MKLLRVLLLAASAMAIAGAAQANVITGNLWKVPDAVAQIAVPSNVPATTPDVVFDVNSPLNFFQPGTVSQFLASGGAFNIVENTAGTLASTLSDGVISSIISFSGFVTVTNGQTFTVTHDDGLTLDIGGLAVISVPGPTAPVVTVQTYTGPSGTFPFQLVYGECCGGAAVLQIDLPLTNTPTIPEPGTLALLGLGLAGLAASRRRKQ